MTQHCKMLSVTLLFACHPALKHAARLRDVPSVCEAVAPRVLSIMGTVTADLAQNNYEALLASLSAAMTTNSNAPNDLIITCAVDALANGNAETPGTVHPTIADVGTGLMAHARAWTATHRGNK